MRPLTASVRPMATLLACLALAACNASGDLGPAAPPTARIAPRIGYSPRGATLAFGALEGAPATIGARFIERAGAEAASRGVETAPEPQAKYVARGYLSVTPNDEGGATLRCVWDVFDARHRRLQRAENSVAVKPASSDLWSAADDAALAALSQSSADDLAAILTNTPEAQPGGALPPSASAYH